MNQLRQGSRTLCFCVNRVHDQLRHVLVVEGCKSDLVNGGSRGPNCVELPDQRMGRVNLVVTVRADQHQVMHVRLHQQILDEIKCRGIEPLQIVEEQRERV